MTVHAPTSPSVPCLKRETEISIEHGHYLSDFDEHSKITVNGFPNFRDGITKHE